MSRLKKTQLPFRWLAFTLNWTQGTAGPPIDLSTYVQNSQRRTLTYSVVGSLPPGVTLAGSTLSYNGTGAPILTTAQFRITDGIYTAESAATPLAIVAVQVNTPPSWTTAASLGSVVAGENFNFPLTATDAQNDTINFIYANPAFGSATQGTQSGGTRTLVWSGTAPTTPGTYTFVVDAVDVPPLGQVTDLTATTQTSSSIALSWSAVNLATGYQVQRGPTGVDQWTTVVTGHPSTSYTDTGLAAGTHYYRVRASNATQTGEYSAAASATTTAAVVPDLPAYVSALAPYQVAALSTVTNGKAAWFSAVDPLYDSTSFNGGGDNAVFSVKHLSTESGGFADPAGRALYALGGGHADGCYNGILKFDLSGTTQATGWSVQTGSESAIADIPQVDGVTYTVTQNWGTYEDGKAGSTHNYGAMVFDATNRTMSRFAGSYWAIGTMAGLAPTEINWKFDFNANQWTGLPFFNGVSQGAVAVGGQVYHDKARRKALYVNSQAWGNFYNTATQTFGASVTINATTTTMSTRLQGGLDTLRSRAIIVGKGRQKMFTINFDAETVGACADFTATGDTEILGATIEGLGVEYDATLDRFWLFGGRDNAGSVPSGDLLFNKIYWINAADLDDGAVTVFSQPLSMTIPVVSTGAGYFMGVYRRYCLIPEWRAIAVATSYNQPVHVIRLPSA
jgi:hypothetical protein